MKSSKLYFGIGMLALLLIGCTSSYEVAQDMCDRCVDACPNSAAIFSPGRISADGLDMLNSTALAEYQACYVGRCAGLCQ